MITIRVGVIHGEPGIVEKPHDDWETRFLDENEVAQIRGLIED